MKWGCAALAASFLAVAAAHAEPPWVARLSPTAPGPIPPPRSLEADYEFGWSGLHAGEGKAVFKRTPPLLEFEISGGTSGMVRGLWKLDASQKAEANAATLRPTRVQQTEAYRGKTLKTKLEFTPDGVARSREEKPPQKDDNKVQRFRFPGVFDLHTGLLFVRSQKLTPGQVLTFVVYPSTSPYLARVKVLGREKITVAAGTYDSIKLDLQLQRIADGTMALEPHKKFKSATAWLSDDADRLLLKTEAEIFVGSVWTELQSVKFKP